MYGMYTTRDSSLHWSEKIRFTKQDVGLLMDGG